MDLPSSMTSFKPNFDNQLDAFLNTAINGGSTTSSRFHMTESHQNEELKKYLEMRGLKLRLKGDDVDGMFLLFPTKIHESPSISFFHQIGDFNNARTGDRDFPLLSGLAAGVNLNGARPEPDNQFEMIKVKPLMILIAKHFLKI